MVLRLDQRSRAKGALGVVAVALFLVPGCSDARAEPVRVGATEVVELDESGASSSAVSREVEEAVSTSNSDADLATDGVVAAALLIASRGDLEAAIHSGLVTEREAEAALTALESGDLTQFLDN